MLKLRPFAFILILLVGCSSQTPKTPKKIVVDKKTVGLLPTEKQPELETLVEFPGVQVTGVTMSQDRRLFASFPRWREDLPFSVVEIFTDGTYRAYPDENWNQWKGEPMVNQFTCAQSVLALDGFLYVLDSSSPEMKGVVGEAKLFKFDLATNKLVKTWLFNSEIAPKASYLNDIRIDSSTQRAFMTDSGLGGLVVLDLKTGNVRRVLDKHPSTKAEMITLSIDKQEMKRQVHSDGIAISPVDNKLYYHALTGYTLYRLPPEEVNLTSQNETELVKKVENLGKTPAPDGMIFDKEGNLYMGDLERNAIFYRTPEGKLRILIQDERIKWPDSFTFDGSRGLIFSDSLLHEAPIGKNVENLTFKIYKVNLPKDVL